VQATILETLTRTAETIDQVDFDHAKKLVEENILSLPALDREKSP
jgi:hypothetical protein